jgi:hypothetical protein
MPSGWQIWRGLSIPPVHTGIGFSCHAFGLSASFYNTGKHPVADGPAVKVFNYLRQFEMRCACDCGYTRNCCVQGSRGNGSRGTGRNCGRAGNRSGSCGACAGRADVNRGNGRRRNCCQACERGGPVPDACSGNRSCCFITAAVCKSFNKPDNCYELAMFRRFRDERLKNQVDGKILIHEYYEIAPAIVKNIGLSSDKNKIYFSIWEKWLQPCLRLIEEERFDERKSIYTDMVMTLKQAYL